ncbi:LamG-like jellyroll fold domain-containing protein [Luteimicrobium sp. NPDC057192]|uniref:LamG-like jellyroll fold domain-containing protein n=1 Tax=Luteimicrobium sp. NPDC057192 TaxID=3346042 RepID=UPI00363BD295
MSRSTHHRGRGAVRPAAIAAALATASFGLAVATPTAQAADAPNPVAMSSDPADTLVVHADQPFRDVTHVASGSLYGLADATKPSLDLARAIKPSEFVMKPSGGTQQATGDILVTAPVSDALGAKVVDRLSDYYPGWPYRFSWDTWDDVVRNELAKVNPATVPNLAAYAPWNESDGTWNTAANGSFEDFWTHTYRLIRSIDPTTPIQGPSFSDNISDMDNFLKNAVETDTVPDILAWHELIRSSKIQGDVETVRALEKKYGIGPLPIDIEEYAAPAEVGIPGSLVGYVAKFERFGIRNAELPFWNQSGTLGDLLTGQGGTPNGAYWLYTWYADMSGKMVTTTPPSGGAPLFDGAASVTADKKRVEVIAGGNSGPTTIQVAGLDTTKVGKRVDVTLEYTPTYGRTVPVSGPVTISTTRYEVGDDGTISVPVVMNPAYGYHVVVQRAHGKATDLSGTYRISNGNSGLALAASSADAGSGVTQVPGASGAGQRWTFVDEGRGLYKVVDGDGLVLGTKDASTANGAAAVVGADDQTTNQLWQPIPDGKGGYRLANATTGLVLAVGSMSKDAGAPVVQWTDGSVTSGCTADGPRVPGKVGKALSFCNTASYATLPTGALSSLAGDYTVSMWVNPASNASWSRVFDIGSSSSASMFLTLNNGSTLRYAITTGSGAGGEQRIDGTGLLPLNQWSLLTVTLSGTTGTLYVNGKVVGTNTTMTNHPSAFGQSTRNYIGKSQYSSDAPLNATVDDFNVYSRALSASEVAALAAGQPGAGDVVHYAFDETSGAKLVDSSGAGRDGTVVVANGATTTTASDEATADHFWTLTRYPEVEAVSVAHGDTVSGKVTFRVDLAGNAEDLSHTSIELNKGPSHAWVTDNTVAAGGSHVSGLRPTLVVDTAALADGAYGLKVEVVSTSGLTTEKTVAFSIDNTSAR